MAEEASVAESKAGAVVSAGAFGAAARLLWFVLLCAILLIVGLVKGAIFGPLATLIFFFGIMAVVIGLWPAHVFFAFRAALTNKELGVSMKILLVLCLPIPLLLWPALAAVGSVLVGLGYGVGQPLVGTFEAVGEGRENKLYHVTVDGTWSTGRGACTSVRDFYDFVFHSVYDVVEEFRVAEPKSGKPREIKLHQLPVCLVVGLVGVLVDTPAISLVALCKMPIMLFKGWRRLLEDLLTRNGPCLEAACVPFAGLAIILWPFIVAMSAVTAILCSPWLGLFSAAVVYQEMSYKCGLKYIVSVVAEFDEYSSDILHTHEGSCLPRPKYRQNTRNSRIGAAAVKSDMGKSRRKPEHKHTLEIPQLNTQKSLRNTIQEVKLVQILDWKFNSMETHAKALVSAGVLKRSDIDAGMKGHKAEGHVMLVGVPAYSQVIELTRSAKANTTGILLGDGTEVTMSNRPKDRFSNWMADPIVNIKDQLRAFNLAVSEERYLEKQCLLLSDPERMESWQNGAVEPQDEVRRAELLATARRLQGMAIFVSRIPTYRRRMENLMKNLQAHMENMGKEGVTERSKSMKLKSKSFNFRTLIRDGSNRFFPPPSSVPSSEISKERTAVEAV